jgi:Eukaryotic aspartyl protease.
MTRHLHLRAFALYLLGAASAIPNIKRSNDFAPVQLRLHRIPEWTHVVNVTIGTPGQTLPMIVSNCYHTWVPDAGSPECDPIGFNASRASDLTSDDIELWPNVCRWGSFNTSLSNTCREGDAYAKGTARRDYIVDGHDYGGVNFTDTFQVQDIVLNDLEMALTKAGGRWIATLGLGGKPSSKKYDYPDFIERLVNDGKIATNANSIWLDNPNGTSRTVLFGSIDKSRYQGKLKRLVLGLKSLDPHNRI